MPLPKPSSHEQNYEERSCQTSKSASARLLPSNSTRMKLILPEASFIEDLGADSLDLVELVMRMEEIFDVEIPDEDAENIRLVQDAINYIQQHPPARALPTPTPERFGQSASGDRHGTPSTAQSRHHGMGLVTPSGMIPGPRGLL